jgi:hypothetical protein
MDMRIPRSWEGRGDAGAMELPHTGPDPEVPARARPPRRYSAKYKAGILAEYESLSHSGDISVITPCAVASMSDSQCVTHLMD